MRSGTRSKLVMSWDSGYCRSRMTGITSGSQFLDFNNSTKPEACLPPVSRSSTPLLVRKAAFGFFVVHLEIFFDGFNDEFKIDLFFPDAAI